MLQRKTRTTWVNIIQSYFVGLLLELRSRKLCFDAVTLLHTLGDQAEILTIMSAKPGQYYLEIFVGFSSPISRGLVFESERCLNYSSGLVLGTCSAAPLQCWGNTFWQDRIFQTRSWPNRNSPTLKGPAEQVPETKPELQFKQRADPKTKPVNLEN